jgi:hypothetical protein
MNDLFKTMSITPRHCFTAPKGKVFISLDFKNQEMYAAGVLSQDDLILNALLNEPETKKTIVDGKEIEYKNYLADLHTITCIKCCFPHLFENQPEYKFVDIAKDSSLIPQKGDPRLYSKVCNFGIIYGQTHVSMAKLNHVTEDLAKGWISQHKETFHKFHDWAEEQMVTHVIIPPPIVRKESQYPVVNHKYESAYDRLQTESYAEYESYYGGARR